MISKRIHYHRLLSETASCKYIYIKNILTLFLKKIHQILKKKEIFFLKIFFQGGGLNLYPCHILSSVHDSSLYSYILVTGWTLVSLPCDNDKGENGRANISFIGDIFRETLLVEVICTYSTYLGKPQQNGLFFSGPATKALPSPPPGA